MMHRLLLVSVWLGACGSQAKDPADTGGAASADTADGPICGSDEDVLELAWPLGGTSGQDWVVVNYVDLDPGEGVSDWTGHTGALAKTYDGHQGVDIGLSSFRAMDLGVPILAAAPGVVETVIDGYEDRHTECVDYNANVVSVRHPAGALLQYVHMRTGSTAVEVGDWVDVGDVLGEVGSSGCSTGPHLHFEVTSPAQDFVSPYLEDLWCEPPVYDTPMTFMESWLLVGPEELYDNPTQDPPQETAVYSPGETLMAYAVLGGGVAGDEISVTFDGPGGAVVGPWPIVFDQTWRLTTWSWWFTVSEPAGEWRLTYSVNEEPVVQRRFEVQAR